MSPTQILSDPPTARPTCLRCSRPALDANASIEYRDGEWVVKSGICANHALEQRWIDEGGASREEHLYGCPECGHEQATVRIVWGMDDMNGNLTTSNNSYGAVLLDFDISEHDNGESVPYLYQSEQNAWDEVRQMIAFRDSHAESPTFFELPEHPDDRTTSWLLANGNWDSLEVSFDYAYCQNCDQLLEGELY